MIFSSVNDEYEVKLLPEAIQTALQFVKDNDVLNMEPGNYPIKGNDIYAQVFDADTEEFSARSPESHREYLDVQYLASGREKLGVARLNDSYEIKEYIKERDLIFYKEAESESFIESRPGCFCVFFPNDVHRPQVISGEAMKVRKVVLKVKVSLLAE